LFDVWDFDGEFYEITTYVTEDRGGDVARTRVIKGGRYWCVPITTLERLLVDAGYKRTAVLRDRFFQPLIVGMTK
jgi:hypothetical protein